MPSLTVLICTHNRAGLLERLLHSLNGARQPAGWQVDILVAANACTDSTHALLADYVARADTEGRLPLRWLVEPEPGKSRALNTAIAHLKSDVVALVDDDHRVDAAFLTAIAAAFDRFPDATMFCGRVVPDWDGSEPAWVHDSGPYRIYPLPVPHQDFGPAPRRITLPEGPLPGGGNLVLATAVFQRVGGFATDLGPKGHDLGGGEDSAFVAKALASGERLQYVPDIVQYHHVDPARLRLSYLLRKAYQRSRAVQRSRHAKGPVPAFMWRKLIGYGARALLPLGWAHVRFYLMRFASALGEIHGFREGSAPWARQTPGWVRLGSATAVGLMLAGLGGLASTAPGAALQAGAAALAAAGLLTMGLTVKSLRDFSQTGPQVRAEVLAHFRRHSVFALARLVGFALLLLFLQALVGVLLWAGACRVAGCSPGFGATLAAAFLGIAVITGYRVLWHLLFLPAALATSSHYRLSRLYPLWRCLTPGRLRAARTLLVAGAGGIALAATGKLLAAGELVSSGSVGLIVAAIMLAAKAVGRRDYPPPVRAVTRKGPPNILLIGADTLRADRIDGERTPFLQSLARRGTYFINCYTPCARTAPSLVSLLTGTFPTTHGIRDNFVSDAEARLGPQALPELLHIHGYTSAALSDWCGADLGKFSFGFERLDVPQDQWNLRFLIRQGPKDLRLFLLLFTQNPVGKWLLPEIHYLAGVPMTDELGREACHLLNDLARTGRPFLLNVFFSTTHPPFGSEYPYYTLFADPDYAGESKFVMARLTDPWEVIRRQAEPREAFDLDQILHLYDGCVRRFDDEVARLFRHLEACGLAGNTIVVIYTDHGMEFFEHDTWGQGNSAVTEHSARVPLLIVDPRRPDGRRVDDVVRSVDLLPTLMDLAGLPVPASCEGASLLPIMEGRSGPERVAYSETGLWLTRLPGMPENHLSYPELPDLLEVPDKVTGTLSIKPEYRRAIVRAKDRMVRQGRWKLVYRPLVDGQELLLFDLEKDPACRENIAADHPDVVARLWREMERWLAADGMLPQRFHGVADETSCQEAFETPRLQH